VKQKSWYVVNQVVHSMPLNIGVRLPLSWAGGMIGVMAVFETKKSALKYVNGGRATITKITPESGNA
jgi:hypothetical protein